MSDRQFKMTGTLLTGSICTGSSARMRSDWSRDARYLLFRASPFGGFHGHEDKLSIEVSAYGTPLLVDAGTYTYNERDPYRDHFVSSHAHNTVVIDGMSQVRRWQVRHWRPSSRA